MQRARQSDSNLRFIYPIYSLFTILYPLFSYPNHHYPTSPMRLLTELMNPNNNLKMESRSLIIKSHVAVSINPSSFDSNNRVSNSLADPREIYRKCLSSLSDRRADPSAIFAGIETAHLRICGINPNFSSEGNVFVRTYTFLTNSKLFFHTSRFWCGFMPINLSAQTDIASWKLVNNAKDLVNGNPKFILSDTLIAHFLFVMSGPLFISHSPFLIPHLPFPISQPDNEKF
jgi:hypothetical protein